MDLILATKNQHKVEEIKSLLTDVPVNILSLRDFPDIPDVEETGVTFAENAEIKAQAVSSATGKIALADDSGLEVDALGGQPGVRSNRFGGPGATDQDKYMRILELLEGVPDEQRTARFRAAVAISTPEGETVVVEGTCEGRITREPSGTGGFGYDPIFCIPEFGKTMAELTPDEKNAVSHRGKALRAAKKVLHELLEK